MGGSDQRTPLAKALCGGHYFQIFKVKEDLPRGKIYMFLGTDRSKAVLASDTFVSGKPHDTAPLLLLFPFHR